MRNESVVKEGEKMDPCLYQNMFCLSEGLVIALIVGAIMLVLLFGVPGLFGKKSRFHTMGRKSYIKKVMEEMAKAEKEMKK